MDRVIEITDTLEKQILAVRDSAKTNMLDVQAVAFYANEMGFYDLVDFLSDRKNLKTYSHFIFSGERRLADKTK